MTHLVKELLKGAAIGIVVGYVVGKDKPQPPVRHKMRKTRAEQDREAIATLVVCGIAGLIGIFVFLHLQFGLMNVLEFMGWSAAAVFCVWAVWALIASF